MKNKKHPILLSALIFTLLSSFALAAETTPVVPTKKAHKKATPPATAPVATEHSSTTTLEPASTPSAPAHMALGFQTLNGVGGSNSAISGLLEIDPLTSLQFLATIGSTSPFQFGVGGGARRTLIGNEKAGFHLGGLVALGTLAGGTTTTTVVNGVVSTTSSTKFFVDFNALAGIHFQIPGAEKIVVAFDGGPKLSIFDGNTNFSISALSPFLGLSVHYFLN